MYIREVDKKKFFSEAILIPYRADDEREAIEFGCLDVIDCLKKAEHPFNRYFIGYEGRYPKAVVILNRCGQISFFISDDIKHPISMVKQFKKLARKVVDCCGPITTKTAWWYKEAHRLNKLIGFKPMSLYDRFGIFVLE